VKDVKDGLSAKTSHLSKLDSLFLGKTHVLGKMPKTTRKRILCAVTVSDQQGFSLKIRNAPRLPVPFSQNTTIRAVLVAQIAPEQTARVDIRRSRLCILSTVSVMDGGLVYGTFSSPVQAKIGTSSSRIHRPAMLQ
jgi:hypothetical protein